MKTMKITTLVGIATATVAPSIAVPAIAHADTQYADFLSPSGDINCSIMLEAPFPLNGVENPGNNTLSCEVVNHTWPTPGGCTNTVRDVPDVGMAADDTAPPVVDCAKYPNQLPLPWPTLDYGQTRSLGVFTCDSEPSGIKCTNSNTGHFFRVSRESYEVG